MTLTWRDANITDSFLSRWDPRWKLLCCMMISILAASLQNMHLALGLLLVLVILLRTVPVKFTEIASRLGLVFLLFIPLWLIFPLTATTQPPGEAWHFVGIELSPRGVGQAAIITVRGFSITLMVLLLIRTTGIPTILAAAHRLHIPGVFIQITQLAYRYSLLLLSETRRLWNAMRCRGFRAKTQLRSYRVLGQAAGTILVRGGDRAERVADAMISRGFRGEFHTLRQFHTKLIDVIFFAIVLFATISFVFLDRFLGS